MTPHCLLARELSASLYVFLLLLLAAVPALCECPPNHSLSFLLETGYVYPSPNDMIESQPGTFMLTECIESCRNMTACKSANYETGLCVLFNSSALNEPELAISHYPVFTLYAQKICLKEFRSCNKAWAFEKVAGYFLDGFVRKQGVVNTKEICMEVCLKEKEFTCRSANFNKETGECSISDIDRHTLGATKGLKKDPTMEYLENNCVDEPVKLCDFQKVPGRIIKTVDSVVQNVESIDMCRSICLSAPYRCHSFDFNDTETNVCRFSHHSSATLTEIKEPYLSVAESLTYELGACYNVTIDCRATEMMVKVLTGKLFNGKIYAKGSPNGCMLDVSNSLEFELKMPYDNKECHIRHEPDGQFTNDIVIQHHDYILTSADLGLMVKCHYRLYNTTVSNGLGIQVSSNIETLSEEKAVINSPNVLMRISDRKGADISSAQVGDPLSLRFEVKDKDTPYEIFVRDLVALDGLDTVEIQLIDGNGCPTDTSVLGPVKKITPEEKDLESYFDAFKFPESEIVSFRALVTPCFPKCQETTCHVQDYTGFTTQELSYGRRRRDLQSEKDPENLLLVQSIHITDKFNFKRNSVYEQENPMQNSNNHSFMEAVFLSHETNCISSTSVLIAGSFFLLLELLIIGTCFCLWLKKKRLWISYKQKTACPKYSTQVSRNGHKLHATMLFY